jgi:ribonuclease HI
MSRRIAKRDHPPQYVLYADAISGQEQTGGRWHFVLESVDGECVIEADECEPDREVRGERLELLSVVRGLEAVDEPARVTLITPSRYVRRGFRYGLEEWRRNQWRWEHFGKQVPIKNRDLWQRVDQALRYHEVKCRNWLLDMTDGNYDDPESIPASPSVSKADRTTVQTGWAVMSRLASSGRWAAGRVRKFVSAGQVGSLAHSCGR